MSFPLTLTSPTYNSSGKFGSSLSGGSGLATNPFPSSGSLTIEAWGKTSATGVQVLVGASYGAWIGTTSGGQAQAHFGGDSGGTTDVAITTSNVVNDGVWHHFSFNIDPSGGASTLYVDGVLAGTASGTALPVGKTNPFGIKVFGGNTSFGLNGEVDEVAVYSGIKRSAAFTPPTAATSNTDAGLLALWHLDGDGTDSATAPTTVPGAPTIGTAVAGDSYIDVAFTAPGSNGGSAILDYTATLSSGQSATGASSPIRITATNGTAATATVKARNAVGSSASSAASISVTPSAAATPVQIAYNNANIFYSPSNWDDRGTYKSSANPGAYLKFGFTGTSAAINVDVSAMVSASLPAASYPIVRTVVDGITYVDTQLTSSMTSIARTGLAAGSHTFHAYFLSADIHNGDRWVTPVNALRISGFTLDTGATASAASTRSKSALFFGDSIWEGYLAAGTTTTEPAGNNSQLTVIPGIAKAIDAEYGTVAFSGQGYEQAGNGGVVAFPSSYASHSSGRSRLVSGLFSPAPDYIFVQHGTNGATTQADVQGMIASLRTAAPNAKIFMLVPANGSARTQIASAVSAAANANTFLIDIGTAYSEGISSFGSGPNLYSPDGLHPNPLSNSRVGAADTRAIQAAMDGAVSPTLNARTVTFQLATGTNSDGTLIYAANLTGAKISFYDEASPDLHTVARYKTASGTFNSTGICTFVAQSTLAAGATGSVVVWIGSNRYTSSVVVA